MKRKLISYLFLALILMFVSLACGLVSRSSDDSNLKDAVSVFNSSDSDLLSEEYRSEAGGYSIGKVQDYNFTDTIGIIQMASPDADPVAGPAIIVVGGLNDVDATADERIQKAREESPQFSFSKAKKIKVDGKEGWEMEVEGDYDGTAIVGRMVIVMVTPRQQFTLVATAPEDRWKELEKIYEAALDSVKLFEANPDAEIINSVPVEEQTTDSIGEVVPVEEQNTGGEIRQWAVSARAGSQYSDPDWSASQAVGEPNVDYCGDNTNAWAPYSPTSIDWIELTYATPVLPTEVNIYQSYNPSQVYEVDIVDTNDDVYIIWAGEPEYVSTCPDVMTISLDLEGEMIEVQKVAVLVDQSILNLGWVEIDAVELVGTLPGGQAPQQTASEPPAAVTENMSAPTNYSGWMAGPVYQGYLKVIPGKTKVDEIDKLLGLEGQRSTENWKPRPTHADTYIYKLQKDNMIAWISVDTSGVVYKKSISANTQPSDFQLGTVNQDTYNELNAIYKRDQVIPYAVYANLLESPGFLSEQVLREDGRMVATYLWFNAKGDKMVGIFYDGKLTGIAGLSYVSNP